MKIELLVDLTNHKVGTVLELIPTHAARMIKNGLAKEVGVTTEIKEVELPTETEVVVEVEKPKVKETKVEIIQSEKPKRKVTAKTKVKAKRQTK